MLMPRASIERADYYAAAIIADADAATLPRDVTPNIPRYESRQSYDAAPG